MNKELLAKAKSLVKQVLLHPQAQTDWINDMDPDIFKLFSAFGRQFIEQDPHTSKMDAFRLGIILGGVYERSRQKAKIEGAGS